MGKKNLTLNDFEKKLIENNCLDYVIEFQDILNTTALSNVLYTKISVFTKEGKYCASFSSGYFSIYKNSWFKTSVETLIGEINECVEEPEASIAAGHQVRSIGEVDD